MTVEWATYTQSLTDRPVKGMLTGPVTMLAWSFVRDDQPRGDTARQVALALRDEVADLEAAGIAVIQVDEPALRETLPLRQAGPTISRGRSSRSKLATSGVRDETQIHTHMCYAEFGDVLQAIIEMDADVISLEAARSKMAIVADLARRPATQRGRPRCVGHPLTPHPGGAGDRRASAGRHSSVPGPATVGQPGLRAEDPRLPRGPRHSGQPRHGDQPGQGRTLKTERPATQVVGAAREAPTTSVSPTTGPPAGARTVRERLAAGPTLSLRVHAAQDRAGRAADLAHDPRVGVAAALVRVGDLWRCGSTRENTISVVEHIAAGTTLLPVTT